MQLCLFRSTLTFLVSLFSSETINGIIYRIPVWPVCSPTYFVPWHHLLGTSLAVDSVFASSGRVPPQQCEQGLLRRASGQSILPQLWATHRAQSSALGMRPTPGTESTHTLVLLGLLVSGTWRYEFLLFKPASLWCVVVVSRAEYNIGLSILPK